MSKDTEGKSEKIMDMESKVLWYPDSKRNTQMDKFRIQVNADYGLNLGEWRGGRRGDVGTQREMINICIGGDFIEHTTLDI